ncbi:uncharacterized protein LOC131646200 [Vicia villosa]|uniref:uncharacterized protein LOC131646200 n=1 Tax=Vicia villosa TaxID=3911 RepID=UPI00273B345D|nr:uncharacterized protein LOC131646200 [Vicia villosa]
MDSAAVKNCIPLSLYTTITTVNHPGPMCMENNPSESKTIVVSHADPINKQNNPSQSSKLSRNSIPEEIAFSILSKLPVKSLKRFACSCKSWSILFENTNFMNMYSKQFMFRHGSDDDDYHTFILTNHLAENSGACHSAFHLLDNNNNSVKLNLPSPLQQHVGIMMSNMYCGIPLPVGVKPYSSDTSYNKHLAVINGSIALISNYHDEIVFHISILGELGVSDSWIKLYTYGSFPSIQWPPIGFGKMGFIYVTKKNYELAYVDLSTQIVNEIGITGGKFEIFYVNAGLYKKSLLSIGGSTN